jgi:hypothetical protein
MIKAINRSLLTVTVVVCSVTNSAVAGTSAYVTSGTLTQTVEQCLNLMSTIAQKTGFTIAQQTVIDKNGKAGDFHADQASGSHHFTARCNSVSKTWAVAVSGINSDQTFSQYKKLYDLLP